MPDYGGYESVKLIDPLRSNHNFILYNVLYHVGDLTFSVATICLIQARSNLVLLS